MKIDQRDIKKHLFICCNERSAVACCSKKGALELVKSLKTRLLNEDLWSEYKVTKSGCLGPCSDGISATLYPDNLLLTQIKVTDADVLFDLMMGSNI